MYQNKLVIVDGNADSNIRSCYDCRFREYVVTDWCFSIEAHEKYNTRIPNKINCEFWEPVPTYKELSFLGKIGAFLFSHKIKGI